MINLVGIILAAILLSGCIVTAASGTRTEYQDKIKIIEKNYSEGKITEQEYDQLKDRASQQGKAAQQNDSIILDQEQSLRKLGPM